MQKFDNIKIGISKCIANLSKYLIELHDDVYNIYNGNPILKYHLSESKMTSIKDLGEELRINLNMITRTNMKCAFFGKTSNGKSAVINAMLHEEVLPSCCGRTTSCFITVEGCDDNSGYFLNKFDMRFPVSELDDIASEYDEKSYGIDSQIRVFWPLSKCDLLIHAVQIVDSPGCDVSANNDSWIEKYCLDADVFVYVIDASSTLCASEKEFFKKVQTKIGNPNLFFLLNKWDICQNNRNEAALREQHKGTIKTFLEEIKLNDFDQENRTFFVSATECLKDYSPEFERYLKNLTTEMSQHAVVTKFKKHSDKGNEAFKYTIKQVEFIQNLKNLNKDENSSLKRSINTLIENVFESIQRYSLENMKSKCRTFSSNISSSIQKRVSTTFSNHENLTDQHLSINTFIEMYFSDIIKNLQKSVEGILPKIRDLFKRSACVKVDDELMDKYMPKSFKELMLQYSTKLQKNHANSDIENAYNELDLYLRPTSSGGIGNYTNNYYIDVGISAVSSLFWGLVTGVKTIVTTISDSYTGRDRLSEFENRLSEKINDFLNKSVKEIINEIKSDIAERITYMTDIFVRDCTEISQLMNRLLALRDNQLQKLSEDLVLQEVLIDSMK